MSPGCINNFAQFIVSPSSLGGVPVLSRPTLKGMLRNLVAKILLGGSPILPPGFCSKPVCIMPPKNVPVVSMTLLVFISPPEEVFIAITAPSSTIMSSTESPVIVNFSSLSKRF